jgi:hypothetical protein
VRVGRGAERGAGPGAFERRSTLYACFDAQLRGHTRFFAAAAWVNAALAQLFQVWPTIRSPHSFNFLNEVGEALEVDNRGYARKLACAAQIAQGGNGRLDHALVCAEQARLQGYVHAHQERRPRQWRSIRRELNGLLNERYAASLLSRWCGGSGRLSDVLATVRGPSRLELDFANESHRILIGLKLIEHVRAETAPSALDYGAYSTHLTDGAMRP